MNCPKCPGKLEKIAVENVKLDVCPMCEGIWFDEKELQDVLKKDKFDVRTIDLGRDRFDGFEIPYDIAKAMNDKEAKCPRCDDGTMLKRRENDKVKGLFIDTCPKCNGIWLDGGEIRYLRDNSFKKIHDKINTIITILQELLSPGGFGRNIRRTGWGR